MKLKISALFLSLCLAILPSSLRADSKTVTEGDAASPIWINNDDIITFSLKDTTWNFISLASTFSDATISTNDSTAKLLS